MSPPSIMKLNETNYSEWVMVMEALLVRKGLLEIVKGEETRPLGSPNSRAVKAYVKKSAEARAEIILNVETSQLPHLRNPDVAELWEELKTVHQARGFGTRMSRRRAFFRMVMDPSAPMSRWIADVRRAAFLLGEIGGKIDDEDTILILTNGLPPSYENFVITLDSTATDDLTLDYVITRLLNEESRQTTNTAMNGDQALVAMPKKIRTPIEKITCFKCQQKGHYQSNCPQNQSAASESAALVTGFAF